MVNEFKEKKKPINIRLDPEVSAKLKGYYRGSASRIISNLSKEFLNEMESNPLILVHVLNGEFKIVPTANVQIKK